MFQTGSEDSGDNERVSPVSLTCPTCRTAIPVPPGGVAQFQVTIPVTNCTVPKSRCSSYLTKTFRRLFLTVLQICLLSFFLLDAGEGGGEYACVGVTA